MKRSIALSVILLCACGPTAVPGGDDDDGADASGSGSDQLACSKLDLLFVVDNSQSMLQEQTNLVANFPQFIRVLDQSNLDYRVAVTTTARDYTYYVTASGSTTPHSTTGESGAMLMKGNMIKRWIDRSDPDVSGTFSTLAAVGTAGSGKEMPLGAVRDAFEDRMQDGTNAGFRRDDALLGVVILTDENDCSYEASVTFSGSDGACRTMMEPTINYKTFLDSYTGHPSRWAAALIAGPGPGQCSSTFGYASEATRLKSFVTEVGTNAIFSSICDGDLAIGLTQATMLFDTACGAIIL